MKDKKLIIKDIQGEIYVISQDGSIKMLKDGDEIYVGEKIFTKNLDAKITLEDGEQINLSAHQSINLDEILKISTNLTDLYPSKISFLAPNSSLLIAPLSYSS